MTSSFRDHPRMCGEKPTFMFASFLYTGSPPHVRGKELRDRGHISTDGITPACAGKSHILTINPKLPEDHPRMCGEKLGQMSKVWR